MEGLRGLLQSIADLFTALNIPEPIVQWGHPLMMAIVIFVMGTFTAGIGWWGRVSTDPKKARAAKAFHSKLAPLLFVFIALGYLGGVLSLVMQDKPIFSSSHFWTGSLVVGVLAVNGLIAATKFGKGQGSLRSVHAYLGSFALVLLFIHAFLGFQLGQTL